MPKIQTIKGVMKTFFWLVNEEWGATDHKLLRLVAGAVGFALMAFFWYFFFRNLMPF